MRIKSTYLALLAGLAMLVFASTSRADPINLVSPGDLTGTGLIAFEDLAGAPVTGTKYDEIIRSGDATFGERFAGQTLDIGSAIVSATLVTWDILSGSPSGPLSLVAGAPGQNLIVGPHLGGSSTGNELCGLNSLGYGCQGSVAVLFDFAISEMGIELAGFGAGDYEPDFVHFAFFGVDGGFISELSVIGPQTTPTLFGFAREGGVADIAGFSLWADDPAGVSMDNIRYDVSEQPPPPPDDPGDGDPTTVPEPSALALLGIGLFGMGLARRRRKV